MHQPYLNPEQIASFEENGYLLLPGFWSRDGEGNDVQQLKDAINRILDGLDLDESRSVFCTKDQTRKSDEYFLGSGDKVRFFWEKGAKGPDGSFTQPREECINKIGHALHDRDDVFRRYSYDIRVGRICRDLGMVKPLACQSMYIFKQRGIGGEVVPHQDGTFLYTRPQSVIGFWWALEDCTTANGCLWGVPGSHKTTKVERHFVRMGDNTEGTMFKGEGDGKYSLDGGVPLQVPAGTLVLLHSAFVHWSEENRSDKSRHAYSIHVVEGGKGCEYPEENWLQTATSFNTVPC